MAITGRLSHPGRWPYTHVRMDSINWIQGLLATKKKKQESMGWGRGVQEGNGGWIGSIYYINVWNFQRIKLVLKKKKQAPHLQDTFLIPVFRLLGFLVLLINSRKCYTRKRGEIASSRQVSGRAEQVIKVFCIPEHLQTHLSSIYGHDKIRKRNSA